MHSVTTMGMLFKLRLEVITILGIMFNSMLWGFQHLNSKWLPRGPVPINFIVQYPNVCFSFRRVNNVDIACKLSPMFTCTKRLNNTLPALAESTAGHYSYAATFRIIIALRPLGSADIPIVNSHCVLYFTLQPEFFWPYSSKWPYNDTKKSIQKPFSCSFSYQSRNC